MKERCSSFSFTLLVDLGGKRLVCVGGWFVSI